jgi:hypothetical protein
VQELAIRGSSGSLAAQYEGDDLPDGTGVAGLTVGGALP